MKVLIASKDDLEFPLERGPAAATLDGELVHLPLVECDERVGCPCWRGFEGAATGGITTAAEVAERALTVPEVVDAVTENLRRSGWDELLDADRADLRHLASAVTLDLIDVAERLPIGTVLGREGPRLFVRAFAP